MNSPRRGEIWIANLGSPPIRHWVLIVSVDERNLSDRIDTVLIVPFSSRGAASPTVVEFPPGETGLPGRSFVRGHYMQILDKRVLLAQERRVLSATRMREVAMAIRRSFDPDAPWAGRYLSESPEPGPERAPARRVRGKRPQNDGRALPR